jgi:hypothetical protein
MPVTTMTIAYVNQPKPGRERGTIKSTNDDILGCFRDKLHLFEPGGTYEITYSSKESGGKTYDNVTDAKRVETPASEQAAAGLASSGINRQTNPIDSKRMFVCATLVAFIRAGKVEVDKVHLAETTRMLCGLYEYALGDGIVLPQARKAG